MKLFLFSIFLCTFAREIHEISHARMGCTSAESMLSALGLHHPCIAFEAQMAESVDALVSNTSGATHPGSSPGLGTRLRKRDAVGRKPAAFFFCTPARVGSELYIGLQSADGLGRKVT